MIIRDILTMKGKTVIHSIGPEQTVPEAVSKMVELDVGSLVVLEGGQLAGVVTPRDVLKAAHAHGCDLAKITVGQVMSRDPIVAGPDDTFDYVRGVMTENHISHLPVMEGDKLVGVISFYDVAKACVKAVHFENALLKRYIKNWPEEEE